MKAEEYDVWVIRIGTVYLVGMPYTDTGVCRLSNSPYDAVQIKSEPVARRLADMAGGEAVFFNPATGRIQ